MKYSVLFFDECARCKQSEPDHEHKNCSFDIDYKDNITIQTFECTRCHFIWKKEIDHEDSIDNRSTLRRQAG